MDHSVAPKRIKGFAPGGSLRLTVASSGDFGACKGRLPLDRAQRFS
jgi:hypothetical protein